MGIAFTETKTYLHTMLNALNYTNSLIALYRGFRAWMNLSKA